MWSTIRRSAVASLFLCGLPVSLSAQTPAPTTQPEAAKTSIIIERQLLRFTTTGGEAVEWQLVVTNQRQETVFDSGVVYGPALEWTLRTQLDDAVQSGLYAYTLTSKAANDATTRTQQGNLIVDRASDTDRVWLTSNQPIGVGADAATSQVTVSFSRPMTVGGAELPGAAPRNDAGGGRSQPTAGPPAQPVTPAADRTSTGNPTANQVAKFAADGSLTDSSVTDSNNTVSIGGTTSYGALTLIGNVPNGDAPAMALYNQGAGAGASVAIDFYNTPINSGIPQAKIKAIDDGAYSDHLTFWTKQPGGPSSEIHERMRITSGGIVGIGTSTPGHTLDVDGYMRVRPGGRLASDPAGVFFYRGTPAADRAFVGMKDDTHIGFAGVTGLGLTFGWGMTMDTTNYNVAVTGAVCAANIVCLSDARLKKNVTDLNYGLRQLLQLRPVTWQWKDPATRQLPLGLIAQDVEGVLPELVIRDEDPAKPLGLNYLGLLPIAVKAIQEQQDTIAKLQQQNSALEARLAALEQLMQQVKR